MPLPSPDFITSTFSNRYKVYVTWVDHGGYVKDQNQQAALENLSYEPGRNFHVSGFRLDGAGDPFKQAVVIPQDLQGSFKLPRVGDVIVVEENYREPAKPPVYIYSMYNDLPLSNSASSPIPNWGAIPNDYGHLRSHRDHNSQFSPLASGLFQKKYIKSITGYRFRSNYSNVHGTSQRFLDKGKFVVRGDSVFDIQKNSPLMSQPVINTEYGMDILPNGSNSLTIDKKDYPNPLNVPKARLLDDSYVYSEQIPVILEKPIETDYYSGRGSLSNPAIIKRFQTKLKVKNYLSYQPVVDTRYYEYLLNSSPDSQGNKANPVERELPAAEEYQVALRGNNKLLIQDQYGDGEQLLITLKNQYDSGFTVVHNSETSQIRVRDHLGQGVLIEGNPESPRVVSWTTERQVIDMGSVRQFDKNTGEVSSHGEYIYLRNGPVYGKSDTSFGRLTSEVDRNGATSPIPQQELAMISARNASGFGSLLTDLSSRLSSGMDSFVNANSGSGLYFRNNLDPNTTNQNFAIFNDFNSEPTLTTRMYQEYNSFNSKTVRSDFKQEVNGSNSKTYTENYYFDGSNVSERYHTSTQNGSTSRTGESMVFKPGGSTVSSVTIDTIADPAGVAKETRVFDDVTNSRKVTISANANTKATTIHQQQDGYLDLNKVELLPLSIKNTQYDGTGAEMTVVEQTASEINLKRSVGSLTINIGSGDTAGTINIGNAGDTVNINGTVSIEGSAYPPP